MNNEIFKVNTLEVITHFLLSILSDSLDIKKLKMCDETKKFNFDTAIYIGIYGNIEGMMLIETAKDTAIEMAKALAIDTDKMDISKGELVKNYIGEIGNIVMTKTLPLINKSFGDSHLSTPSVFMGSDIQVNLFYKKQYSVAIETPFGKLRITFAVKDEE